MTMADQDSGSARETEFEGGRREYSPPRIVHTETLTSRASVCAKSDITCHHQGGPIQS
jgi:hypothetical protein